ncbi:unnamed protein product, partial [Mycena citricolor]
IFYGIEALKAKFSTLWLSDANHPRSEAPDKDNYRTGPHDGGADLGRSRVLPTPADPQTENIQAPGVAPALSLRTKTRPTPLHCMDPCHGLTALRSA